jgi:broad specificity phosphatase PhoE
VTAPDPRLEGRRLYLMRHGRTYEPRLETRMASADEDPQLPLTDRGREEVRQTAKAMSHLEIDAAFSSTLLRTRETAGIIAAPHGLEPVALAALQELRLHAPAGGTLRDVWRRYLDTSRALASRPADDVRLDCGRSVAEIVENAHAALRESLAGPARRVLVVAHGGINRLLLTGFLGQPLARFLTLDQDFACVNVIDFAVGGWPIVRALNVTPSDLFKSDDAPLAGTSGGREG